MKSILAALLSSAIIVAHAFPSNFTDLSKRQDPKAVCGKSMYIDQTSDASPTIDDCNALADNLSSFWGWWYFYEYVHKGDLPNTDEDPIRIWTWGSCAFGIRKSYDGPQEQYTEVGIYDAQYVIWNAVFAFGRFKTDRKIGAAGAFECGPGKGVWWGLYHS